METCFYCRHDNRWRENDRSIVFNFYQVTVAGCQRSETDPPT